MCKMKVLDVIAMQECLEGYKKVVEWMPFINDEDERMKLGRLQVVDHLIDVCEDVLSHEKGANNDR